MINFTVGPVQQCDEVRTIGGMDVPYFRTPEFSEVMFENEKLMLSFADAMEGSRGVFITGSGTASMEAVIINTLTCADRALVVNGGSFGQRFVDLLKLHAIPYSEISLPCGAKLTYSDLEKYENQGYTSFLVNVHETSTGVHYDMELISGFCKRNNLFLIVDAISSFLADPFSMKDYGADVMITGSQKALACPPGVSVILLSPSAVSKVEASKTKCMYLDLKSALSNQKRGQTPFTPAVGILLQINARLKEILKNGGVKSEIKRTKELALYFRNGISGMPFEFVSNSMSNAVTALRTTTVSAYDIFTILKDEYGIWVCPNGGELKDTIFRVGHIGFLTKDDYDELLSALSDMQRKGVF